MDEFQTSPYAPIRLRYQHWWHFARHASSQGLITASGMVSDSLPTLIMAELIKPLIEHAARKAKEEGSGLEFMGDLISKSLDLKHWVPLAAQFELNGKQIFDIHDSAVSMLRNTDVSDCNLHDWRPPYDAFFVRFGKQHDMSLRYGDGHEYLDGAFVAVTPWTEDGAERRLKIGLTTIKDDGTGVMMPGYFLDLLPDELKLAPGAAIDSFIQRKSNDLDADPDRSKNNVALIAIRKQDIADSADLMKKAIDLVVNCLFYIESHGEHGEPVPGRDVPPELHVKWAQAAPLRKHKATQKINSDGYAMVRMMGEPSLSGGGTNHGPHADVSTHWRRGHWRQQAHGPQRSMHKRVWIRPVMVNPSKQHEELPGHVYVTGTPGNSLH